MNIIIILTDSNIKPTHIFSVIIEIIIFIGERNKLMTIN